jgi:hypothetical protein
MNLRDLGGIFSRYFLVGFFVPAVAALAIAAILLDLPEVPALHDGASVLSQLTILIAIALFASLVLLGIRRPIIRLLEGYPLEEARRRHGLPGRSWCPRDCARHGQGSGCASLSSDAKDKLSSGLSATPARWGNGD